MDEVLKQLSADCPTCSLKRYKGDYLVCGIMLPDMAHPTPPDVSPAVATPRFRIVGGRG